METPHVRLFSLDALRGLDMFCISGLDLLVGALALSLPGHAAVQGLAAQFRHCAWTGLTLYDCIFPLFVFLAGVSMSFSLSRGGAPLAVMLRLLRRAGWLMALGWVVNGAVSLDGGMRYASVLGLIGFSCLFGGLIFRFTGWRGALIGALAVLLAVAGLQCGYGELTPQGCINALLDQRLLPGRLHNGSYDPEGLLCVFSAVGMNLLGALSGCWLRRPSGTAARVLGLLGAGVVLFALGCVVLPAMGYPCIKNIWTSSFVLAAAGLSMGMLALFHLLVDVLPGGAPLSFPLRVVGLNALACYLLTQLVDVAALSQRLFCGLCRWLPVGGQGVALALGAILLLWGILWFFYRRRIFFKA